jgi:hypothetical protein
MALYGLRVQVLYEYQDTRYIPYIGRFVCALRLTSHDNLFDPLFIPFYFLFIYCYL